MSVLLLVLLGSVRLLCAQDSSAAPMEGDLTGEKPRAAATERMIFKQDGNGQWRAVPLSSAGLGEKGATGAKSAPAEAEIPDFFLSKLTLNGDVTDIGVELTADVTVQIITPDRWLRVPLRFDQALLLGVDHEHAGQGEAAPVLDGKPNEGISWLLRGEGEHQLRLSLRLPLRKTVEGEQLQLQLPKLGVITGKMELRVPSNSATFRDVEGVRLLGVRNPEDDPLTSDDESQSTIATAELTGERLDLRWNVVLQPAETMVQEPTEITLRLMEGLFELTAHQEVQFREGQRKAIRVRYPSTDFELSEQGVRVSDSSGTELWVQPSAPDDQSWVTIPVEGVVGNLVELDWRFTRIPPEESCEIVIDGFEVADTPRHTGTVTVESPADYRVSRIENGEAGIKRIDVNERAATSAYGFSGGQFRLKLNVEAVVPSLSVTPYYFLLISPDRVELEAAFQINAEGGSFRSVPIQLQEKEGTSWVVHASSLTAGELRPVRNEEDDQANPPRRWTLQLPEAVDRQTVVGLSAAYFFGLYSSPDTATFSLPTITGARTFPGWLIVATADNVEVLTRARAGTTISRQDELTAAGRAVTLPDWMKTQPQTVYRLTMQDALAAPGLETDVTVRTQQTKTSAVVELSMLEREFHVSQRIAYNVEYGRISRIHLQIPPRLAELTPQDFRPQSLKFSLNGETPLEAEWSGSNVSLDLPSPPRLGEFEIVVGEYAVKRTPSPGDESLAVPIIRSLDQPYETVRLSVPDEQTMSLSVADPRWTHLTTVIDGPQWITDQVVDSVDITLNRSLAQSPLRVMMTAALLQSETDEVGSLRTTATYLVPSSLRQLVTQLPEEGQNLQFEWNGEPLPEDSVLEEEGLPRQFRFNLPKSSAKSSPSRLTIRYLLPPPENRRAPERIVPFPVFPEGVWIKHTWWELTLPRSQHLFVSPTSMTPQFQWQRDGFFWSRKPTVGFQEAKSQILQDSFLEPLAGTDADSSGNVYAFDSFGSPPAVKYVSLSQSLIVFLGAGLTLTISFLLVKVPAARHPSLWMLVGLAVTAASLWYLEPMLLLLQPAAYGLVLPICAALLEYATDGGKRTRQTAESDWGQWGAGRDSESAFVPNGSADSQRGSNSARIGAVSDSGIKS